MRNICYLLEKRKSKPKTIFNKVTYMRKFKLTLAAAALVFSFNAAAAPLSMPKLDITTIINGGLTSMSQDVRIGGFRMSRSSGRNFGGMGSSSSKSSTSSSSANKSSTTNNSTANNTNTQRDAQFNNTTRANANTATAGTAGRTAAPGYAAGYTGSPFLSSLSGTMTGMLLANMLFGSTAQASQQTAPVTPQSLTDGELKQCIADLDSKMAELEDTRSDILNSTSETKDADLAQLDQDQKQLKDLQLVLLKEQIERLQ